MKACWGAICLAIFVASSAQAQAPTPLDLQRIQQQQNDILRQQGDQRQNEERLRLPDAPTLLGPPTLEAPSTAPDNAPCFVFHEIKLEGALNLTEDTRKELTESYIGRCLTLADMNNLIRALTNYYIDHGYVTSRAYLPPQDLKNGALQIQVLEGLIERIDINEDGAPRAGLDTAFPGLTGEVLNIRDIEQGLDQINRLQSFDATVKLEPGDEPGASRVELETKRAKPWTASIAYDNYGQSATGQHQVTFSGGIDDLLGLYDGLSLSFARDTAFDPGLGSRDFSGTYSIPFGYWSFRLSGSEFNFKSTVQGESQNFRTSGFENVITAELERVIYRDSMSKMSLSGFLTTDDTKNFVENVLLVTGSRRLTIAGTRLTDSTHILDGIGHVSVGVEGGLKVLGALHDDPDLPTGTPQAQYVKAVTDLGYTRPFKISDQDFSFDTTSHFEGSPDTLFNSQGVSIGGPYTVRGFRDQGLIGDIGGYLRNELALTVPIPADAIFVQPTRVQLYGAIDAGWVTSHDANPTGRGILVGSALGIRANLGPVFADGVWERPIVTRSVLPRDDNIFGFRVGATY
jgi:hemolysin activation/secretion protein